jgi:hypothetical protein
MYRDYRLIPCANWQAGRVTPEAAGSSAGRVAGQISPVSVQSSNAGSALSSQLRWSPQNRDDAVYRRLLCGRDEHERAAAAVEPLLDLEVEIVPRAGQENLFPGGFHPRPLRAILETLQKAVHLACWEATGQWGSTPPDVHLKGGLASKAIVGQDLCEAVVEGADIDLQLDAFQWVPSFTAASDCTALTGRIATVWIASLLRQVEPSEALGLLEHSDSLRTQIFQKFFTSRVAIGPAYSPQPNPQAECWTLYGVRLRMPGGSETHLDLTAIFRSARPFLSDDAAFQVRLPLGEAPVEVTSWVAPKEGRRCVTEGVFTIPDLDQVQCGAFEKVLSKQARGCRYGWVDARAEQMVLLHHFQRACGDSRRREPWEAVALAKLRDIPQPNWTPWQRIALSLQLVQLFPDWVTLEWWPDVQEWPEGLQALEQLVRVVEGPQRAALLQALAPLLSARLQALGLTGCPAWWGEPGRFLDFWLALPAHSRLRRLVSSLDLAAAEGPVDPALVEEWFHRRAESASPEQDSKLLLALLAEAPIEPEQKEVMAAQICLEVANPSEVESLLARWPNLRAALRRSAAIQQRGFYYLSEMERRGRWLETFAITPVFLRLLEVTEALPMMPAARLRAIWTALDRMVASGGELPAPLCQKVLDGLASGHSPVLQQRVLPEMLFQGKVPVEATPLVMELMRAQLGRDLDSSLLGREIRAWLHLLNQAPESLNAATVQSLFEAIERRRWQEASVRVEEGLVRAMAQVPARGAEADRWVLMLERQAAKRPQLWQTLAEQMLPELGWESSKVVLEALSAQRGWTPAMVGLLNRWLQDPERGLEMAQLAAQRGWPLSQDQRWAVWVADVVKASTEGAVHEAITRLQAYMAESDAPAPEPQQRQLEQWIRAQSSVWLRSRRQRKGIVAGAACWQLAQSVRAKWSDEGLLDALLQGLWDQALGSAAAGAPSRALVLPTVPDVEERELRGALLRAILRKPGLFPQQERMSAAMLLQGALHHPELLRELLADPIYGVNAALQALTIEERRAVWQPLLRDLGLMRLFEVAAQTGMMTPLEPGVPAASPEWLESWGVILERSEEPGLEQGWIELCVRSVGRLSADPASTPVLERALRGCGRLLVVKLLAEAVSELVSQEGGSHASCSTNSLDEQTLWEMLKALSQALAMRGRAMTLDPMHLPMMVRVLSDRIVSQPATLALTLERASLVEPGLASRIVVEVLRRQQAAGPRGLHGLLDLVRGSAEIFRVLIGEPERGRVQAVKQSLCAIHALLADTSETGSERAALSSVVPGWLTCINATKPDAELLDSLQLVQEVALEALETRGELDVSQPRRGLSPLRVLMSRQVELFAAEASHSSSQVPSEEVLIEMSFHAMARIADYLCRDPGRAAHVQWMQERLQKLAEGSNGSLAEQAGRLNALLAAMSWGMSMECGSVVEERLLRQQTRRALEEVSTMHASTRERVAQGMCEAVRARVQGAELEQTLALRLLAIFWTAAIGQTSGLSELMKDLDDIDWSCHPEVLEEAAQIMSSAFLGYADLCKADPLTRGLWLQLERAERPLLLDRVMLDCSACLTAEPSGVRPWLEILDHANRRLEQEATGPGPVSYQKDLAAALLLRSTVLASSIVSAEIEQACPDQPDLQQEVMRKNQAYLDRLVARESLASERIPELLFAIFKQNTMGFLGFGGEDEAFQLSPDVSLEDQMRCRQTLGKILAVLAEALLSLRSGPRLIRAYSKVSDWQANPIFKANGAHMPWAESLPHQLMERIEEEYGKLYVRAELEAVCEELPDNSALAELLGLAGPLLEIPLQDNRALRLLTMYGSWLGSIGRRAPVLEERFVIPQLRQIGARLIAWLATWRPDSDDYSVLEGLATVPDAALHRALKLWCEHHRSSLRGRSQKAAFATIETRIQRMVQLTQLVAIQEREAARQRRQPAAAASSIARASPSPGTRRR